MTFKRKTYHVTIFEAKLSTVVRVAIKIANQRDLAAQEHRQIVSFKVVRRFN